MPSNFLRVLTLVSLTPIWGLAQTPPQLVQRWEFDNPLPAANSALGAKFDVPGPRSPEFPRFSQENHGAQFDGKGARIVVPDREDGRFDFKNGDAITLEAWVMPDKSGGSSPMYVIGKGRTGNPGFAKDNQNWALRVVAAQGDAKLSFLFATSPGGKSSPWARWTSDLSFALGDGWRHVAVSYRFGDPSSIRGWIDGQPTKGQWDLGGPTAAAPIVDDDSIWIGSSMGGSAGNSFRGRIDHVAVWREHWSNEQAAAQFQRVGGPRVLGPLPAVMPELGPLPPGQIQFTLGEGMPDHRRWLRRGETRPEAHAHWEGPAFLLHRIPLRYDSWGIRDAWQAPLLLTLAGDVPFPAGEHRILLRARGLGRLWIDGKLVAETKPITKQPPNGEEPITPIVVPPAPGARPAGYHQQEVFGQVQFESDGPRRVVLELAVGGKSLRTETGELLVARAIGDDAFEVLGADAASLPLIDPAVEAALSDMEASLRMIEDDMRRALAARHSDYWQRRHAAAREWSEAYEVEVPAAGGDHPIDRFLQAKATRARAAAANVSPQDREQANEFHQSVLPLLRTHCFRCHGEQDQGGLRLTARAHALQGGDSGPAIVPGKPDESELIDRIANEDADLRMPPSDQPLPAKDIRTLRDWVANGAPWPERVLDPQQLRLGEPLSDEAFLRRAYLDTIGIPPSTTEVKEFLDDNGPDRRVRLIDRLLADPRVADHLISVWLDLLAENPTLLNASLNSTGPFRWFLHDSLRDNKPFDRLVTELIMMRGGVHEGGSAGFGVAAENDSPMAAKGHVLASAFLGIELQCARCHDSPYHQTTQRDLYSLAAMLGRKPLTVPATSRVPAAFFEQEKSRQPLIQATLKPNEPVSPRWPFASTTGVDESDAAPWLRQPDDSRERLAALITSPQNRRFSQVLVNRIWRQLMGAGLVEPLHDWEGREASHPQLLRWLAREFVANDYDLRHVMRLIMTSAAYQRQAAGSNRIASPEWRFFLAPDQRRLTAEQIVDSLHAVTRSMKVEELTFVHDGRRALSNRLTLGQPTRAWMFGDLKNERDRPSLSLPEARAVVDVLEAFGWTGARQMPVYQRDIEPNVLQPGVIANGVLTANLTRASAGSELADLAVETESVDQLVEELFLRILTRRPTPAESAEFTSQLEIDFARRVVPPALRPQVAASDPLPLVTWFNHLRPDANTIQQERERRVREGPPPDPRLLPQWREVYEDVIWSLVNHRDFVWSP